MRSLHEHSAQKDTVRRLRAVTRRVEAFFASQIQRLDAAMRQMQSMQAEYDAAKRLVVDLDQQRTAWQTERDTELRRLEAANEALARSWTELEKQLRELEITRLQQQNAEVVPKKAAPAESGTEKAAAPEPAPTATSPAAPVTALTRSGDVEKFVMKQLQNQVQQHQRRKR